MSTRRVAGVAAILLLGSTVPVLARSPPSMTAPVPPPRARPAGAAGTADGDRVEREGPFVTASAGVGSHGGGVDLQLGWMAAPWIGLFASFGGFGGADLALPNGKLQPAYVSFDAAGVRLGSGVGFELQIASLDATNPCEEADDPCLHRESTAVILGGGVELVHTQHFGLHLRTQFIIDGKDVVPLVQIGLGVFW